MTQNVTKTISDILTLIEAAEFYKVSERTMWQLAKDDEVPHFKVGKQYRFLRSRLIEHARVSAPAQPNS